MRRVAVIATAAVIACVGVACSGGSDDAVTTGPTTVDTPVNAPSTTASPTSTTSSSSVAQTTTTAPTTTIDPTDVLIAEIEADLNEGEQALISGAADPASTANREILAQYFAGKALELTIEFYDQLAADNLRARPNTDVPSVIKVLEVVEVQPDRATLLVCRIDAAVLYQAADDGSEIIFNDSVTRYDTTAEFELRNGTWLSLGGGETSQELAEVTTCD